MRMSFFLNSATESTLELGPFPLLGRCLNNDHRKLHPRFIVAWYVAGHLQFPERGTLLESVIKGFSFASRNI